jgi:hypothetical protein
VAADADARPLCPVYEHRRVPPDVGPDAPLDELVAREPRLGLGRDRVDVIRRRERRHTDLPLARPFEQAQHDVPGTLRPTFVDHAVERLDPLVGLLGIDVGQLTRQAVTDHRPFALRSGHS